ncbi:hypothetical protein Aam_062_017 [Acidocella aminolytica 101 = DSM 11237]|jgi:hypothetical protein|uniref:Uncharacterized protein n=1 Tax=Acidocella aminolytica 101 = DSM 11237 TaxID=1120923 RepID=A0A0D6PGY3_9PROT|nr:hypothetical protein Aam_062_017 [Acidocella aminolytica 101 = DSM 11237]GBQ35402.1 hypothetical protein AA11237_0963 [Acidocella aminolytica 101 = DSM 11237]
MARASGLFDLSEDRFYGIFVDPVAALLGAPSESDAYDLNQLADFFRHPAYLLVPPADSRILHTL